MRGPSAGKYPPDSPVVLSRAEPFMGAAELQAHFTKEQN
jgi:hypothetical protein